jgi:hypothetical protein
LADLSYIFLNLIGSVACRAGMCLHPCIGVRGGVPESKETIAAALTVTAAIVPKVPGE